MEFTMSMVAPKQRKHLGADALFRLVQKSFANIPDHRCDDAGISLPDALMSAFAMFSLTSPSLLAFDKQRAEGNLGTIYGMTRAPCDTSMRETRDPVSPESLRPSFTSVFRQLQRGKALEDMVLVSRFFTMWGVQPMKVPRLPQLRSLNFSLFVAQQIWGRRGVSPRRGRAHRLQRCEPLRGLLVLMDIIFDLLHTALH